MLINDSSIRDLNGNLPADTKKTDHRNWRPNILIDGSTSYCEDNWNYVKIGDCEFQNTKPCTRCVFPTINADTGERREELLPLFKK